MVSISWSVRRTQEDAGALEAALHLVEVDGPVVVGVKLLEGGLHRGLGRVVATQLHDPLRRGGDHNQGKLGEVNLSVVVGVGQDEQGVDLLGRKVAAGPAHALHHLGAADGPVVVRVKLLEGLADDLEVAEALPELGQRIRGGRDHELGKLQEADLAVLIGVAQRKHGLHLVAGEAVAHAGGQLFKGDGLVTVAVKPVESLLSILDALEGFSELSQSITSRRNHQADKLSVVDLAVLVDVSRGEDGIGLLIAEAHAHVTHASRQLLDRDGPITVGINLAESRHQLVDVFEAVAEAVDGIAGHRAHDAHKLAERDLTVAVKISQGKDNVKVSVAQVHAGTELSPADLAITVGVVLLEALLDVLD